MLAEFGEFLEKIIASTWNMLNSSSPWIIFSFLVAGLLHEFLKPEKIQKTAIGSGKISGVFWTTISGMFIPICSCGTIPLGISMYYSGAYLGPTLAFIYTADELIDKAWKYRTYWGSKGGITVSGGEPLLQIDFLLELFQKAKERGINTTLDTCGNPFTREEPFFSKFQELMKVTDLVMLDIKHIDDEQHKILTGQTNKNILDMAEYLSETGKPVWIRHVLVPERSDKDEYLHRLHDFIETLDNVEKVEVLPYHTLGVYKWKELGIPYQLEGIDPPSQERVENANRILETAKYHA